MVNPRKQNDCSASLHVTLLFTFPQESLQPFKGQIPIEPQLSQANVTQQLGKHLKSFEIIKTIFLKSKSKAILK